MVFSDLLRHGQPRFVLAWPGPVLSGMVGLGMVGYSTKRCGGAWYGFLKKIRLEAICQ